MVPRPERTVHGGQSGPMTCQAGGCSDAVGASTGGHTAAGTSHQAQHRWQSGSVRHDGLSPVPKIGPGVHCAQQSQAMFVPSCWLPVHSAKGQALWVVGMPSPKHAPSMPQSRTRPGGRTRCRKA